MVHAAFFEFTLFDLACSAVAQLPVQILTVQLKVFLMVGLPPNCEAVLVVPLRYLLGEARVVLRHEVAWVRAVLSCFWKPKQKFGWVVPIL